MTKAGNSQISGAITLLITIFSLSLPAYAKYSGGTGEPNDPYQIATAEDLMLLGETPEDYDKHFILTADIDLDPNLPGRKIFETAVIGTYYFRPFTGVFDANGYVISNLNIQGESNLGLFGNLGSGAKISNLGLEGVDIYGTSDYIGGLVGGNSGSIDNCYSTGKVKGTGWGAGGLVGSNSGNIASSYSNTTVTGDTDVGSLVGTNWGSIATCYSTGMVKGNGWNAGGLVGHNIGSISTSYSNSIVTGDEGLGGLVGYSVEGIVLYSVWDVETSGQYRSAGGVGLIPSEMMDPYMLGLNGFANDPNWVLDTGNDYPRLVWEGTQGNIIPVPDIEWLEGFGTEEKPYCINTAVQLILLHRASGLWNKNFILGADINLDPNLQDDNIFIEPVIPHFSGVFDGNDYRISNLTIEGNDNLGLFGSLLSGAEIRNLGVVDVNITGSGEQFGGLVGFNSGTVIQCYSTGTVSGNDDIGGLVGWNIGSILKSYSNCTVTGYYSIGGLLGSNGFGKGVVTQCYSTGMVSGNEYIGGLVGGNGGNINTSYSTCAVSGDRNVGGLVGITVWQNAVTHCYSTGMVSGNDYVGGLVGNYLFIDNDTQMHSMWDIETSGQISSAGGLGKTTAEMQMASTFFDAGWDFVSETENGTEDIWKISEGLDYPRLWWELNLSADHPDYDEWVEVGEPVCWCYKRQCHGDTNGKPQGKQQYWVSTDDLDVLIAAWNKPFAEIDGRTVNGAALICADFDHKAQGKENYRVSTDDLDILIANWNQANAPAADCP